MHSLLLLLAPPDLSLFLLKDLGRNATDSLLCTEQEAPQLTHEVTGILAIQEACQVDLHHPWVWVLVCL